MLLFKTSGDTFQSVIENQKHAYKGKPRNWSVGEIVLVSKNKKALSTGEKQIGYIMKIQNIRKIKPGEISELWPGNEGRWDHIMECDSTEKLNHPFNLKNVLGEKSGERYGPVQQFCKLDEKDEEKIHNYLFKNESLNL